MDSDFIDSPVVAEPIESEESPVKYRKNQIVDESSISSQTEDRKKMRKKKSKGTQKKRKVQIDLMVESPMSSFFNKWFKVFKELWIAMKILILSRYTLKSGLLCYMLGLVVAFGIEFFNKSPRYNIFILLVLFASEKFQNFRLKSIRAQVLIALFSLLSIAMDAIYIATISSNYGLYIRLALAIIIITKVFATRKFLQNASGTMRARKYLIRRIRLFSIPWMPPKRLTREIRGRILAIGWIQLVGTIAYLALMISSLTTFQYSVNYFPSFVLISVSLFLILKTVTTAMIYFGIYLDTDTVLNLGYFGCLGCAMQYYKAYVREKKEQFGWPYPYGFNQNRFQAITIAKIIDVGWGIAGWIIIASAKYPNMELNLKLFLFILIFTLLITDIWCSILFMCVHWLLSILKDLKDMDLLEDSDDSELDELQIRTARSPVKVTKKKITDLLSKKHSPKKLKKLIRSENESSYDGKEDDDDNEVDSDDEDDSDEYEDESNSDEENDEINEVYRVSKSAKTSSKQNSQNQTNQMIEQDISSPSNFESPVAKSRIDSDNEESLSKLNTPQKRKHRLPPIQTTTPHKSLPYPGPLHLSQKHSSPLHTKNVPEFPLSPYHIDAKYSIDVPNFESPQKVVTEEPPKLSALLSSRVLQINKLLSFGYYFNDNARNQLIRCDNPTIATMISNDDVKYVGSLADIITSYPNSTKNKQTELVFDLEVSINTETYGKLWDLIPKTAEFTCEVLPKIIDDENNIITDQQFDIVMKHLEKYGFYLVSYKLSNEKTFLKLYVCSVGYYRTIVNEPILCLFEIQLISPINHSTNKNMKFNCICKCTEEGQTQAFVAEFRLKKVFELV